MSEIFIERPVQSVKVADVLQLAGGKTFRVIRINPPEHASGNFRLLLGAEDGSSGATLVRGPGERVSVRYLKKTPPVRVPRGLIG